MGYFGMRFYIKADTIDILDEPLEVQLQAAGDARTRANILYRLEALHDYDITSRIAENPSCPPELLRDILYSKDYPEDRGVAFSRRIADNSNCPADVLEQLATHADRHVRYFVAGNPSTPDIVLLQLAVDPEPDVRWGLVEVVDHKLPADVVDILVHDENADVRQEVADRADLTLSQLWDLANDPDEMVRWSVATNEITPQVILEQLAEDPEFKVRWQVARNPKASESVLKQLAEDEESHVAEAAAHVLKDRGLL